MKKIILILASIAAFSTASNAQIIFSEDFSGFPNGQITDPNYLSAGNGTPWWSGMTGGTDPSANFERLFISTFPDAAGHENTFVTNPLTLAAGASYTLDFTLQGLGAGNEALIQQQISYDNGISWIDFGPISTYSSTVIIPHSHSFTAAQSTGIIRLNNTELIGLGNDFLIDDVVITQTSVVVPEPSSTLLLGFGGLAFLARRKRA